MNESSMKLGNIPLELGIICIWAGDAENIPKGWILCDGRDLGYIRVPDLRSRFIIGAGGDEKHDKANKSGDASTITTGGAGNHHHSISLYSSKAAINPSAGNTPLPNSFTAEAGDHSHDIVIKQDGKVAGELRPKWYALCFIMYIGK